MLSPPCATKSSRPADRGKGWHAVALFAGQHLPVSDSGCSRPVDTLGNAPMRGLPGSLHHACGVPTRSKAA